MGRTARSGKTAGFGPAKPVRRKYYFVKLWLPGRVARPDFPDLPVLPRPLEMKPPTDYIRHAARLARKLQMDAAMGGTPQPDAEFYKTLSKAFDEIAAGLELVAKPD
jgi:hypothetical protein